MNFKNIHYHRMGSHWTRIRSLFSLNLPFGLALTLTKLTSGKTAEWEQK